eukprot:10867212-Prorocentrum_lima.AAC.1
MADFAGLPSSTPVTPAVEMPTFQPTTRMLGRSVGSICCIDRSSVETRSREAPATGGSCFPSLQ